MYERERERERERSRSRKVLVRFVKKERISLVMEQKKR